MDEAKTQIIFGSDEELEKRKERLRAFRGPKVRKHLLDNEHEQILPIVDGMILDGESDAFVDELLKTAGTPGNERTFEFLRFAALIMGQEFIRSAFFGKVLTVSEACRMIREEYHEKQMEPFKEIYDNLDEKLRAAREGEETVKRQIETLKMQNNHAGKLYAERLGKAKMEYHYKLQIAETKAQVIKERLEDKVKALTKRVDEEQEAKEVLQKENEKLRKNTGWFSRWRTQETKVESEKKLEKVKEEETVNDPTADERRELCIQILGNEKFTGEQIDLIIPALEDESIPLGTLKILCRPDLPVQNMKGLIRFITGGKKDHEKQRS